MGGPEDIAPRGSGRAGSRAFEAARRQAPGLSIIVLIALAATWLADHYRAPVMLFALLLGMAVNFLRDDPRCRPGVEFAAQTLLRLAVALLGARITLAQVGALGGGVLLMVTVAVIVTMTAGWALSRAFRLRPDLGVLTGGAVAICGASAALALAAVLPRSESRNRDAAVTVVTVTALSTIAMVIYPLIAASLGLGPRATGLFLGATIHDVAQVVGAGYGVSKDTGDAATLVKLFRVALLLPTVLLVALIFRQATAGAGARRPPPAPAFLVGFAILVGVNSMSVIPAAAMTLLGEASRWLLVAAIAAVGTKTSLADLARVGWRPILLIALETLLLLGLALAWLTL